MKDVQDRHLGEYGDRPLYTVRVPGITRFLGPFADYSGGCSLCAADSRVLYMCVSGRSDSQIRVFNSPANDRKHFSLASLRFRREDRWANCIKGVLAGLAEQCHGVPGLNITLGGNLLQGDNATVCSSLAIATGLVLQEMLGIIIPEPSFSGMVVKACISFCGETCCNPVVRSMICAQEGSFVFFDNYKGDCSIVGNPFTDSRYALLVVDSGLPVSVMKDELDRRREEMKLLTESNAGELSVPFVFMLPEQDIRERLVGLSEEEKRIYLYLFEEFRAAQLSCFSDVAVARAMGRTGKALRNILDLSFPELDWIVKRSLEMGSCAGATVVATGGTGKVGVAMERKSLDYYRSKLEDYEHIFGFKVGISEFEPCSGAKVFKGTDEDTSVKR